VKVVRAFAVGVLLATAGLVPAQEPQDALTTLRTLEIAGDSPWSRDQIASALAGDSRLRALRDKADGEVAAALAERVCELHRRDGYADAAVHGETANGVLQLTVTSGKRYRRGEVRCSGNTAVSTNVLRERLAATATSGSAAAPYTAWTPGEFGPLDDRIPACAVANVLAAYRDAGRPGAQAEARLVRDDDRMALVVSVTDEGREVRVRSVQIVGEPDDAQWTAIRDGLRLPADALATTAALADLQRQVETTGRYLRVRIDLGSEPPAVLDPLTIRVEPRPGAAAFTPVRQRDAEQLQMALDRLIAEIREGLALRFSMTSSEPIELLSATALPGTMEVWIGRDGFAWSIERLAIGSGEGRRFQIRAVGDELSCELGEKSWRWRVPGGIGVQLRMTSTFGADGLAQARWAVGFSTGANDGVSVELHPATAAYALTSVSAAERDEGDLVLRLEKEHVRIRPDGEVVDRCVRFAMADTGHGELSWRDHNYGPAPVGGAAGAAVNMAAALEIVATLLLDVLPATARADVRVPALLRSCAAAAATMPLAAAGGDVPEVSEAPSLDDRASPPWQALLVREAAVLAVDRSYGGRLEELAGLVGVRAIGDARAADVRLRAFLANEASGPLVLGVATLVNDLLGEAPAATICRRRARARLDFARFYADAADLAGHLVAMRPLPGRIGAAWRAQPELKELLAGLPEGETGDLAAWRKGLELLWTAGGEKALRDLLTK
jgi:hypothetical protein